MVVDDPRAVIIAVGDELLSGHTRDTNSHFLAQRAFAAGYPVQRIEVVGDDLDAVAGAIARAVDDRSVTRVAVCGGIGPTPDDRTFEAVGRALGRPLHLDDVALAHIAALVRRMHAAGWTASADVSEANRRCALVPEGSVVLPNRRGMAPPLAIEIDADRYVLVLPGIPREFTTIVEEEVIPRYFTSRAAPVVREVRYRAVPEAEMFEPMRVLATEFPGVTAGSYPQMETYELVIRLRGRDAAQVDAAAARLRELRADD